MQIRPPFPYVGSKAAIAGRVAAEFPAHRHYVEVCAGSLAVLLAKPPSSAETVNDLNGDLVAFWRTLRDHPHELARAFEGDLACAMMGLFPCNILYLQLGRDLLPRCTLDKDNMFYRWIEFYTLPAYEAKCKNEIAMVNRLCENKSAAETRHLLEIFAVSCNYEILQWRDMYYKMETWPLEEIFPQ